MIFSKWYTGELPVDAEAIRRKVFMDELGWPEEEMLDGNDPFAWNLLVKENDVSKAAGRLTIDDDGNYVVGFVAVLPEYRKNLIGDFVVRLLTDKALSGPPAPIIAMVPAEAVNLFEVIGYAASDEGTGNSRGLIRMVFPAGGKLHGRCGGC